ncbi:plasmalemma vesicle associated protein a [Girardinichthys multiradiatus]|uniref:plasmalemma vesicle associated protein a n=1 Tax=Girardinichthys multiradiatus TaxID=208333 RepID=UPI001FAC3DB4|nr:plasmalemma vesicle associated protein a [Girardinichthys multiradiatus]
MYSSRYSQVKKFNPEAQKKMQYRSKGKSCGYYVRIIFFFSSLIQSLIIVSLVLFLIYGKTQASASSAGVQDLEESFSRLSIENVALRHQRKNLTNLLNTTLTEKARNDWDLVNLRGLANRSITMFQFYDIQLQQCNFELVSCKFKPGNITPRTTFTQPTGDCNCGLLVQQMKAGLELMKSNLTQTKQIMTMEKEQIAKERDNLILEAIRLRRDKSTLEKELELFRQKSKDQFSQLLGPISSVSKALLEKIDSLFPKHLAFQLTCAKQKEHLEQIQTNCTSLSREVENKLQRYLDIVGDQVSNMQIENNHLKAENWRLSQDYRWCSQNRTSMIEQHKRSREELQLKHDQEKEKLLMDKLKMTGEIEVLKNSVKYKNAEVDHLKEQINHLNMSCMARSGLGGYSGGVLGSRSNTQSQFGFGSFGGGGSSHSSSSTSGLGQGRTGTAGSGSSFSSGSGFNRAPSTGVGSSSSTLQQFGSSQTLTNTGQGFNKPGSTGAGTSSSTFRSSESKSTLSNIYPGLSSAGTGVNKPASTGGAFSSLGSFGSSLGSSGTGSNKPAESGRSSTTFGSSFGSVGSSLNQGSSGTGLNKPALSGASSTGFGFGSSSVSSGTSASSGSSGSTSKTPSSGFNWFGLGSSTSGQSKTESVPGKTFPGSGNSGTGSAFGGKTNGLAGSPAVAQHIQELQRLINPPVPQEKQDLSRMLG